MNKISNQTIIGISGISLIAFVIAGSFLVVNFQAYATGCYDKFIFNWFSANDVFQCLDNGSGGSSTLSGLSDVSIINLINSQIIKYNSTLGKWQNVNQTSFSDTTICNNLGSGYVICPSYSSGNINIRTLLASSGISLSNTSNSISIDNTGVLKNIAGNGISVNQTTGNVLISNTGVRSVNAGTGIAINATTGNTLITNSLPESTVCNNSTSSSGHYGLCESNVIALRTLLA